MSLRTVPFLQSLAISLCVAACTSGALKMNQSDRPAAVEDRTQIPKAAETSFTVLIVPSGAIKTSYISDKTSTAGGVIGSMIIGPMAGAVGGLVGSTAGSTAASSAEARASSGIDSSDIAHAVAPIQLPRTFATMLGDKLKQCGIRTAIYPTIINPELADWQNAHLVLPAGFSTDISDYRFFVEAGVTGLQVRDALTDATLEGNAYARVYESSSLRQIGRYAYKTGSSGSVTLTAYDSKNGAKVPDLQRAARQVSQYLAGGIANDMCSIMRKF